MPSGVSCSAIPAGQMIYGGPQPTTSGSSGDSFSRTYPTTTEWRYLAYEFDVWLLTTSDLAGATTLTSNYQLFYIQFGSHSPAPTLAYTSHCSTNFMSAKGSQIKFVYKYHVQDIMQIYYPANPLIVRIQLATDFAHLDSMGFRNFKIWNIGSAPTSTTISQNFPCASGSSWNGTACITCYVTCQSCSGSKSNQCTACKTSFYDYGNGVCHANCAAPFEAIPNTKNCTNKCSTTFYWARNLSCVDTCEAPRVQSLDSNNALLCSSPCSIASQYVYPDKSCSTTCGPLLKEKIEPTLKICLNPCQDSATGVFLYPDGACVDSCLAPWSQKIERNISYCYSTCSSSEKFVYPDKSCSPTCDPRLISNTVHTLSYCISPCGPTGYLYPDGSCVDRCPIPWSQKIERGIKYCYSNCSSATESVYPDKTCFPTCDPRLISNTVHTLSSCLSPCDSTEYLYPDGSCGKTCPAPFSKKTEKEIQYCDNSCFHNKTFLYEDGTCQETCNSPSITKDFPSIGKTCKFPCANIDYYYNNRNGKCTKTCESTSEAIESPLPKLCVSTLSEEEVKAVQAVADTANSANSASSTGSMIWSIVSSSDSTAACLGPLAKMLQYIKFMDIKFPEKVLILMDAQSKNSEGFSTKMVKGALDKFPSHELPRKFKVYQSSSSFFVNFWPAFFNLSVLLLVTGLVVFGTVKTKGHAKINGILKSLMEVLKWNVFLITFCGSVGDIVLYTSMEFQTVEFSNFAAVFSFILCLATNTFAVMVVMKIIDVNSSIRKSKKKTKDEEEHKKMIEQEWSHYKALFDCYKDYSFYQQIFLFVFLVRLALFNAAIGYLYTYPLFQAVVAVVSNILMLGYLVIKRPMKKIVSLIQQIVLELVLLPFNVCVLALAIMDHHEIVGTDHRKSIGEVIVYINVMVPFLSLLLMAVKAIAMGVDFYKSWKLAKANKIKKLASAVQTGFRHQDLLNTTEEKFSVDMNDQSMIPTEHHSVQSNPMMRNQIIKPNFIANNYYHQNSIPLATSHNFIAPEYQNSFQQQPQFDLGIIQEEMLGHQHFQNGSSQGMPRVQRRKINKRRDRMGIQNYPTDME